MTGVLLDLWGWMLLPCVLACGRGRSTWPRLPGRGKAAALAGIFLFLLPLLFLLLPLPFGANLCVLAMLRGLFGGLSIATILLLQALVLQNGGGKPIFAAREERWLPLPIAAALLFYPPALGMGPLDPYAWGYGEALPLPLPLIAGALALAAWLAGWRVSALALVLALAAWRLRLHESANLWDYLLDPLLVLAALGVLAARGLRRVRAGWRAGRAAAPVPSNASNQS
ncbi:MAG: hypothetical protein LBS49_02570 [Candidatus Accumulibacter sp.]|jgi:hypothetical protein|nr:hypothetical protein [Accumulibacter sp.]